MSNNTNNLRNKMTNMMMERVYARSLNGQAVDEIILDIAQDEKAPTELRFKAAAKVADLIFPKAASVEVEMEATVEMNRGEMDARLKELLGRAGYGLDGGE